ncbi:hypothetical protein AR158_C036L [Paramecium bursaria Chlorella virus AR158]|uniref:homing endonuclease n=1 Tax=Paramecium bursaria Chlorella virus AR158 TaxID=380598 RepID=UPI00015AA743|nr:homing endonuclease [Paramecium bursaria Chlorella virus AR158]ABU43582.1 hypothetical protein AR158_C036L [Paramecium bursaria Chlorella virus AR158]
MDTDCLVYVLSRNDIPVITIEDEYDFVVNPDMFKYMYIGITNDVKRRWKQHLDYSNDETYKSSQKLYRRLRKHGWDAYNKTIVKSGLTREEAKMWEIEMIARYRTFELGLNSTPGGDGSGTGADHPLSQAVNVYNNSTGEITSFVCQRDAAKYLGVKYNCIWSSANHDIEYKNQTYSPKFDAYFQVRKADDSISFVENMPKPINIEKEIIIVDIDTRVEMCFASLAEAGKYLNIDVRNIQNMISGKAKQFYVNDKRYDAQYVPKTREWNFDAVYHKSKMNKIAVVNLITKHELEFNTLQEVMDHFEVTRSSIAKVLSDKCVNKQFYVEKERYDIQYLPKTREWNFDLLSGNEESAKKKHIKIAVSNIDTGEILEFDSMKDAATHFGISQSVLTQVISDKYSRQYFTKENHKYDVKKLS